MLIGPNLAGTWKPEQCVIMQLMGPISDLGASASRIWDTGFAVNYADHLGALAVERFVISINLYCIILNAFFLSHSYPTDNCFARYGYGTYHDAQQKFATYMTHASGQQIVKQYLNSSTYAQTLGKRLLMFETNSASCGACLVLGFI